MSPTPEKELEAVLQQLDAKKAEWANLTTLKRADLLRATLKTVIEVRAPLHRWCCGMPALPILSCRHARVHCPRKRCEALTGACSQQRTHDLMCCCVSTRCPRRPGRRRRRPRGRTAAASGRSGWPGCLWPGACASSSRPWRPAASRGPTPSLSAPMGSSSLMPSRSGAGASPAWRAYCTRVTPAACALGPHALVTESFDGVRCRVESLFFGGMKGEIWVQPGKPASQVLIPFSLLPSSGLRHPAMNALHSKPCPAQTPAVA